jgi:hypothetical protein
VFVKIIRHLMSMSEDVALLVWRVGVTWLNGTSGVQTCTIHRSNAPGMSTFIVHQGLV